MAVIAAAPLSLLTAAVRGDSTWISSAGGSYSDPSNWSFGVATGVATFGPANGSYNVAFSGNTSVTTLDIISNSNPTFLLNGFTYTVGAVNIGSANPSTGSAGNLTIANGKLLVTSGSFVLGGSATSSFTQLAGSALSSSSETVGNSGAATFNQTDGTNTTGLLSIASTGAGTYTLSGGILTATNREEVGNQLFGSFT
jgi:hypothetical protein